MRTNKDRRRAKRFRKGAHVNWVDFERRWTLDKFNPKNFYSKTWWWINKIHKQAFK